MIMGGIRTVYEIYETTDIWEKPTYLYNTWWISKKTIGGPTYTQKGYAANQKSIMVLIALTVLGISKKVQMLNRHLHNDKIHHETKVIYKQQHKMGTSMDGYMQKKTNY